MPQLRPGRRRRWRRCPSAEWSCLRAYDRGEPPVRRGRNRRLGSVDLKAMPIDSVTISDAYDPGERAPTRRCVFWFGSGYSAGRAETDIRHVVGWRATRRCQILRHWVAALLLAAWITGIGGCLGRGGR